MFYKHEESWSGPFNVLKVSRECSGLTGACIAVTRSLCTRSSAASPSSSR